MKLYDVLSAIVEAKKKQASTPIQQDEKFKESLAATKMVLGTSPKEKDYRQAVEALITLYLKDKDRPHQLVDRDAQILQVRDYVTSWLEQNGVAPKESKNTGEKQRQKNKSPKAEQPEQTPADTPPHDTIVEPDSSTDETPPTADDAASAIAEPPVAQDTTDPSPVIPADNVADTSVSGEPADSEPEASKLSKPAAAKSQPKPISKKQQLAASGDLLSYAIDQVEKNKDQLGVGTSSEELQQSIIQTAKSMLKNKYKMTPDQIEQMIASSGITDQIQKSIASVATGNTKSLDVPDDTNAPKADSAAADVQVDVPAADTVEPKSDTGAPDTPDPKPADRRTRNPHTQRRSANTTTAPAPAAPTTPSQDSTQAPAQPVSTDTKDRLQTLAGIDGKQSTSAKAEPVLPKDVAAAEPTTDVDKARLQKLAGIKAVQAVEPEPEIKPWTPAWVDMRRQQLAKMDPEQRLATKDRAMRMVGQEPTDSPVDLIKGLKKFAQAPRGSTVQRTGGYQSMFREMKEYLEAQSLLQEELTLDQFMQIMTETTYGQAILSELEHTMGGKFMNERIEQDYEDDEQPTKAPIKIPTGGLARKGEGMGCRDHVNCRHNDAANDGEHSRTVKKKTRRRDAKQQHPRNLDELSTDTLKKYIKGAAGDIGSRSFGQGLSMGLASMTDDDAVEVPTRDPKISKRERGIATALGKLTKNKMNEVGKDTLKSYLKKAIPSAEKMAHKDKVSDTMASDDVTSSFGQMDVGQSKAELQHKAKLAKRKRGINTAIGKLEEEGAPQMENTYTLEEWMGMMQEAGVDEGRLSKLAAGLGLGTAALMGSPEKAQAQQAPTTQVPNDSVQTGTSRDLGMAQRRAEFELDNRRIDRRGVRQSVKQNPDGTWSVTIDARKQPTQSGAPQMENAYTLEEWVGMMKEMDVNTLKEFFGKRRNANTPEAEESAKRIIANMKPHMKDFYERMRRKEASRSFRDVSPEAAKSAPQNTLRRVNRVDPALDLKRRVEEWVDMVKEAGIATEEVSLEDMLKHLRGQDEAGVQIPTSVRLQQILTPKKPAEPTKKMVTKEEVAEESYTLEEWMGMLEELGMEESADVTYSDSEQNPEDTEAGESEFQNTATHRAPVQIPTATKHPTLYKPEEEPVDTPMSRELRAQHPPVKIEETLNENAFVARMQVLAGILPQS